MSARASKRLLAALDTDEAPSSDTRPSEFERLTIVSADMVATICEVFAGTALPENETMVRAVVETRHEIEHAWSRAKHSFITIGRALNRLDAMMRTKSERAALKSGFERLFPLSEPIASQFRRVAEAIDSGRLPEGLCPASYSAAYQLALLEPDELDAARGRGLVASTTSRSALIAERRRIDVRLARLRDELENLQARRKEIARVLNDGGAV